MKRTQGRFSFIPNVTQNLVSDKASAPDLQQAKPARKQVMFKNMADARSCKDGDAGAVKNRILNHVRYTWGSVLMLTCCGLQSSLQADISADKYQTYTPEGMDKIELLISQDEIKSKIKQVAQVLDAEYEGEELTIVMVMKGAICIAADLIRELKVPCTVEYVKASSYGQRGAKRGELKVAGLDEIDLTGKNVLLVDDIYDSGETLTRILAKLQEKNPKTLKSLVLLAKDVDREVSYYPDFALFEIQNQFVIGYGLDYKEHYRGLPGVFLFKSDVK